MAKFIIEVEGDCTNPEQEKQFHDWYNNFHLPDVLETPCFYKATRYELTEPVPGKGKFLAVYEFESDNLEADMAKHHANMKRKFEQGRMSGLLKITSRGVYKEIITKP